MNIGCVLWISIFSTCLHVLSADFNKHMRGIRNDNNKSGGYDSGDEPAASNNKIVTEYKPLYEIDSIKNQMDGYIESDAPAGSKVKVEDPAKTGEHITFQYLRLEIENFNFTEPAQEHEYVLNGNKLANDTGDLEFQLYSTDLFNVTDEGYVVNSVVIGKDTQKQLLFYVQLTQDSHPVSNLVPFKVRVEVPPSIPSLPEETPHSAIYAGILILLIVFMALLIPTVFRAKRRYKKGKPLFLPGKARTHKAMDKLPGTPVHVSESRSTALNLNGYTNEAMDFDDNTQIQKDAFVKSLVRMVSQPDEELKRSQKTVDNKTAQKYVNNDAPPNYNVSHAEIEVATNMATSKL